MHSGMAVLCYQDMVTSSLLTTRLGLVSHLWPLGDQQRVAFVFLCCFGPVTETYTTSKSNACHVVD